MTAPESEQRGLVCASAVPYCTRLKFDLEKLTDNNVLETFQAMTGGRFSPLTIMSNEDTGIDSMITTFNTAVTETATEILGKHRQKKKPSINAEIFDLCDKRRELRKKRFEPEGSEKYKEVNNNIKRCMERLKKAGYENSVVRLNKILGRTTVRWHTNW